MSEHEKTELKVSCSRLVVVSKARDKKKPIQREGERGQTREMEGGEVTGETEVQRELVHPGSSSSSTAIPSEDHPQVTPQRGSEVVHIHRL